MPNTCKSSEKARKGEYSGARVRNTWVIYLEVRNNSPKGVLMPDETTGAEAPEGKDGLCMQAIASR